MNAADIQARTAVEHEHVPAAALAHKLLATPNIVSQHGTGRRMKRHQTGSTELGSSDRQHALLEIDVVELQVERLGDTQTGDAEQTEKAVEHPRPQWRRWPSGRQAQCSIQQALHLLLGVQVGPGT